MNLSIASGILTRIPVLRSRHRGSFRVPPPTGPRLIFVRLRTVRLPRVGHRALADFLEMLSFDLFLIFFHVIPV